MNEESGEKEKERERMGEKKAEAEKREQNRTEEGACNTRADRTRVKIVTSRRDDGPLDEQTPSTSTSTSNHFDPLSYLDSMLSKRKASPSNAPITTTKATGLSVYVTYVEIYSPFRTVLTQGSLLVVGVRERD